MGRMTITVEESLVAQAQKALGTRTKTETIRIALMEIVRKKHLHQVLTRQGKVDLDLDQVKLTRLRDDE